MSIYHTSLPLEIFSAHLCRIRQPNQRAVSPDNYNEKESLGYIQMHYEKTIYCLEDNNLTFKMDFRYSPVPYIRKPYQPDASESCLGEQHERILSSLKVHGIVKTMIVWIQNQQGGFHYQMYNN